MMHSSTLAGSMPARRTASATTSAPSCGAVKSLRAPRNFPVGVRTAETMTESFISGGLQLSDLETLDRSGPEQRLQSCEDDARRPCNLPAPLRARRVDEEHAPFESDRRHAIHRRPDG